MAAKSNLQQTPAEFLRTINIIHLALIAGQVLFAIVALAQTKKLIINVRYMRDPLVFMVPLVAASGFIGSNVLFKKRLNAIDQSASLKNKLIGYQAALITRFSLLEGPSLFGIVAFFISGQLFFLLISAALVVYFIYIRPTKANIEEVLNLNYEEKAAFSSSKLLS